MEKLDRITSDPEILNGQPCIRHMRLSVKRVLEAMTVTPNWSELMEEYPGLEEEDIRQSLVWAANNLDDHVIHISVA